MIIIIQHLFIQFYSNIKGSIPIISFKQIGQSCTHFTHDSQNGTEWSM